MDDITDLETILKRFYMKEFKVFKQNGELTKKGCYVYDEFCSLIYDLSEIVEDVNPECIENQLDIIVKQE